MGKIIKSQMDELFDDLSIPQNNFQDNTNEERGKDPSSPTSKTNSVPVSKAKQTKHKKLNKVSFCVRITQDNLEKVRILSDNKGIPISDIIDLSVADLLQRYEKKNGKIRHQQTLSINELLK